MMVCVVKLIVNIVGKHFLSGKNVEYLKIDFRELNYFDTVDPQYRRSRDWWKKRRWRESYITKKKHIRDLKISFSIGEGGQRRGVFGGLTTVLRIM